MTGGTVVVLGQTGRNFGAGMSGGVAYVLDVDGEFAKRCNTSMVTLEPLLAEGEQEVKLARDLWHGGVADERVVKQLIENHMRYTGSAQAKRLLERWDEYRPKFIKVFPNEYRRALGELAAKARKIAA
jgi:glutamate synthase (NADPH/NADH) large chain